MPIVFGAPGVFPTLRGQPSNIYSLQAGEVMIVPAGDWYVILGKYLSVQEYDAIAGFWRWSGDNGQGAKLVHSDGVNFRVANQTGCAVAALITTAGSAYTTTPTVTPSAGSSVWAAIIGGVVSTTVTVNNGGTSYVYPPQVAFAAPGGPGQGPSLQAAGYCTLSAGAVSTVTLLDQGAGYTFAPQISFINDPRDTTGSGASATATLTGAGTMTGLICTDHGTPLTAVPTLSFSSGSAAATVIMDWCITGYSATVAGAAYTTLAVAGAVEVTGVGGITAGTATLLNGSSQVGAVRRRRASIVAPTTTGGGITATGAIVDDGGHYEATPNVVINGGTNIITTAAQLVLAMGGLNDTFGLFPA